MSKQPNSGSETTERLASGLLSALSRAGGLQSLVDASFRVLGNPIVVTDKAWKALAITGDIDMEGDECWREFKALGSLSFETVSMNIRDRLTDRIEQSEAPFIWQEANMAYPRIFCRVLIGRTPVATVSVAGYLRPFLDSDLEAVSLLCRAVSAELQKSKFLHYTRGMMYEDFLGDLLSGRVENADLIYERAEALGLGSRDALFVLAIDIKGFDREHFSVSYMRDYLEGMIAGSKAVIFDERIVIIAGYSNRQDFFSRDSAPLSAFLGEHDMRCGVSRAFDDISSLKTHYNEAVEALKLGSRLDRGLYIYSYDEYAVYNIIRVCSEAGEKTALCHPKLPELMDYDREHKTSLASSLYAYLRCSRNTTSTAAALHIHRNTMIYHLRRIEELTGLDLSDSNTLLQLDISFMLLEYEKRIDRCVFTVSPQDAAQGGLPESRG